MSEWYYARDGEKFGPVHSQTLKRMAKSRVLMRTDLVWKEGMSAWQPAAEIDGLFAGPPDVPPVQTNVTVAPARPVVVERVVEVIPSQVRNSGGGFAASRIAVLIVSVVMILGWALPWFRFPRFEDRVGAIIEFVLGSGLSVLVLVSGLIGLGLAFVGRLALPPPASVQIGLFTLGGVSALVASYEIFSLVNLAHQKMTPSSDFPVSSLIFKLLGPGIYVSIVGGVAAVIVACSLTVQPRRRRRR